MDYTTMLGAELADECRNRRLPAYGAKPALIARLTAHDQAATRPPIPEQEQQPMVQIVAGPDTGQDSGDDLLEAVQPTTPAARPAEPERDPRDQMIIDMQAQMLQLQAQLAARPGHAPTAGDVATPAAIAMVTNREQVYRAEFVMHEGVELGDGLHASFIAQTARKAVDAGYTTRGGAHRVGWGTDDDGNRTAIYEIYARK